MSGESDWMWLDGEAVATLRSRRKLRQSDITREMGKMGVTYGFSTARISHIETGNDGGTARGVTRREATALAAVLRVSVWRILVRDPDEDPRIAQARDILAALQDRLGELGEVLNGSPAGEDSQEERPAPIQLRRLMDG
jgi:transcriptional regulator with XRE-family HTH domain